MENIMTPVPDPSPLLLISSLSDPAGTLIHAQVRRILAGRPDISGRFQHLQVKERLIYLHGPDLPADVRAIIFLSRHSSRDPRPVLTVHVTGNYGDAEFGGEPGILTLAATSLMHAILNRLSQEAPSGYDVCYEATHHGPTSLPVPSCFVEVGSTEKEWNDPVAATAAARAVVTAVPDNVICLAGFGGTHYAQRQTEVTLNTRGGFGHIMPSRALIHLDQVMFDQIISGSDAIAVYIDRKSLPRKDIVMIESYAATHHLPVIGQSDLVRLKELPFSQYSAILSLAEREFPGSTVTLHALTRIPDPVLVSIPDELLAEAVKHDPQALEAGLDLLPVVHLSGKGSAYYSSFITDQADFSNISNDLINLCVSILQRKSECRSDGDCLILIKPRFDPEKAGSLGVPPGPAAGRLMAGETLVVNGNEITPEMVITMTEKRICIPGRGAR